MGAASPCFLEEEASRETAGLSECKAMSTDIRNLEESLDRLNFFEHRILSDAVEAVVAAWGHRGAGAEWEGGFLLKLKDGRFAYLTGWCGPKGWDSQDGISIQFFECRPAFHLLAPHGQSDLWRENPADLNHHLHRRMKA
jgi:hypothetical protein